MFKRKSLLSYIAFPAFFVLIAVVLFFFWDQIWGLVKDRDAIRSWIRDRGTWGNIAFILLQSIQVIIFILPGEIVQIAGGYIYGIWTGTGLSLLGIAFGSIVNFYIGRILGRTFVDSVFSSQKIRDIERVLGSDRGIAGFFLFFLIPGIPKDALCYVAGISGLKCSVFIVISMAGRLPGIVGSALIGGVAYSRFYTLTIIIVLVVAVLFLTGVLFRSRIQDLLVRLVRKPTKQGNKKTDT